jgi:two-component system sensor histidine kinase MprB
VHDVVVQIEELTRLIGDLVDLARDAEPAAAEDDVRLDDLVARAVERAQSFAPGLTFDTVLAAASLRAVPERLDRAIANLLDNAAKWSPADGTVEVRLTATGELTVRDHGPGIAEDDLTHVFDRFYRAAAARALPGSGLGLSIVRQVVEAHGGTVVAENAPGGGALFRVRLPASAPDGDADATTTDS